MSKVTIKNWLKFIIFTLLINLFFFAPTSGNAVQEPVNILVLNSYHQGLKWTDDQIEGIIQKLRDPLERQIYIEYMDWKRYPNKERLESQYDYLKTKYQNKKIDLLLTTDDVALQFALNHRQEIFSNAPIVFSGVVKSSADQLLKGQDRVTGVYESSDAEGTLRLALQLNPHLKSIYILHDQSESGRDSGKDVLEAVARLNAAEKLGLTAYSLADLSIEDIDKKVATLGKESIVLVGSYNMDKDGKILSPESAANQVSINSSVPVFSLFEFLLDSGVTGGSLASGWIQGEYAGDQALKILGGRDIGELPILEEGTFVKGLNYKELVRFQIPKKLIPKNSTIINKPFSFVETYRTLVYSTGAVFVLLLLLIVVLLANVSKRKKVERHLRTKNEEITAMHEELTAVEEELRQQFDELVQHQEQLKNTKELYQLVLEAAIDAIWDWDILKDTRIFHSKTLDILGYSKEEISKRQFWIALIHPEDQPVHEENITKHLKGETERYSCDYRIKAKNGNYRWIRAFGKALFDEKGKPYRMVGSHRDISELKEQQMRIEYLAYHDFLTGLPNRAMIQEIIHNEIVIASKKDTILAVLFLDIDNFKSINDSYGHTTGDKLLIQVGRCLSQILGDQVVSRLAGDEFLILLHDLKEKQEALAYAKKIMGLFEKALTVGEQLCYVSASVGIAFYPEGGDNYEELLNNADTAMHNAKELGKRNYVVFDQEMKKAVVEKAEIQNNLRKAIEAEEFVLHYQPQVDPYTGKVLGLEALIRWQKDNTIIPPNKFIGIAEETGLIVPIGEWVLQTACVFLKKLHNIGHKELTIAVNISAIQLHEEYFVEKVLKVLRKCDLDPSYLELEITETMLIEFFDTKVNRVLTSLKENNIKISLDDFGRGYSSLNYLKELPISTLKVDKSFVDDINNTYGRENMTGLIVSFAHELGLKVVAEGVERLEQKEYLMKYKCDAIQGYLASRPLPEDQVIKMLESSK